MAKILVIDDEVSMRTMVQKTLVRDGHEVFQAGSGREALEYLKNHPVDLIVTDLYMPDMDGIELTIRIGQQTLKPPIIAMSGGGFTAKEELLETARRMGAGRTLAKPFAPADLLQAVRDLLPGTTP